MTARNTQKHKAKRKAKQKEHRRALETSAAKERADFFYAEAQWLRSEGKYDKALEALRRALKRNPENVEFLRELVGLGIALNDPRIKLEGLERLQQAGRLDDSDLPVFLNALVETSRFSAALEIAATLLERLPGLAFSNKRSLRTQIKALQTYCAQQLAIEERVIELGLIKTPDQPTPASGSGTEAAAPPAEPPQPETPTKTTAPAPQEMEPVAVVTIIDTDSFLQGLSAAMTVDATTYAVALEGHRIQFRDAFENLICLSQLKNIRSFWYQEETARKVLKRFRGRALLSDEVGLGKTIEAGMVLKEYIQRGMVRTALILTPAPLVSQWREELRSKFDLEFVSTDDADFRKSGPGFWDRPLILASLNQAKSARNFERVTAREYDMVIVDEAHHVKNKTTLNWKLVNALKKRFLLLLTATPVENNLMELYNLITLLKPGQLKTATAFREEFMTRGDPTSPQNRIKLKELLSQVMIRNTRALAKLNIPPRFARTIRIEPTAAEKTWYDGINRLVRDLHGGDGSRLLLKSLLAEAGSSPRAVQMTLERMAARQENAPDFLSRIEQLVTLGNSLTATGKNRMVLKLLRSNPGKMIIFVKYVGTLEHISEFLTASQVPHAVFHGGLDNLAKERHIEAFRDALPVLVTTEIGGEGRNLQFCHQMINYDLPWNPMKIEQRIGRLHRIGQTHEVQIYNLCASGSIEDYILEILDRKINMFEMVIGEIDMVLGRVQGEKDFSELVYDIWVRTASDAERRKGFDDLGRRIKRSKTQYETTRALDEKLFGENYEL